jgi:hypothetical protein
VVWGLVTLFISLQGSDSIEGLLVTRWDCKTIYLRNIFFTPDSGISILNSYVYTYNSLGRQSRDNLWWFAITEAKFRCLELQIFGAQSTYKSWCISSYFHITLYLVDSDVYHWLLLCTFYWTLRLKSTCWRLSFASHVFKYFCCITICSLYLVLHLLF